VHDLIPVGFFVQFLLSVLTYVSGRSRHSIDAKGAEVFRIYPAAAWSVVIGSFAFAGFLALLIINHRPTPLDSPLAFLVAEPVMFGLGLLGIYYLTLRVRVDAAALSVTTAFGRRSAPLADLATVTDEQVGKFRTLRVVDRHGRQILRVRSSFLGDYADLVDLLRSSHKGR
jgi:hypothetical protein